MIQRIQTIFLAVAGIAFLCLYKFPFATSSIAEGNIFGDRVYDIFDNPILMVMVGIAGGLALLNLVLFKNRALQLRLGYLLIILGVLIPMVSIWLFVQERSGMSASSVVNDGIGIYLPIVGLIMAVLANIFIRKDEKLVRSSDRLR